ncbi:MAG: hypothetical protein R3A51_09445 [Nannocystaceae bacterium]|nr:hypothetical protein [Myxococcales bacterium]
MGVKSRLCALVLSTSIVSCVDPAVDARAVWVDAEVDGEGVRTLHLYDQGELRTYEIGNVGPTTSGATATLILEQDPVARGVLVRAAGGQFGGRIATYVDVDGRRNLPILLEADGRTPARVSFTADGSAVWWLSECADRLFLVPLASSRQHAYLPGESQLIAPIERSLAADGPEVFGCPPPSGIVSAKDAPVIFSLELDPSSAVPAVKAGARVQALRVPEGDGDIALLGEGRLRSGVLPRTGYSLDCPGDPEQCQLAYVDPDGEAITMLVDIDSGCNVERWSWRPPEDATDEDAPLELVSSCVITDAVPEPLNGSALVAAISPRHYVYATATTVIRQDIESGALDVLELPRPDPGESRRWYFRRTRDGRSMYVVSSDGPMVVVGVDQLRVISDASFSCPTPQAPLLSPSGRFAAWTCVDYGEIEIPLECLNRPTETDSDGDACAEAIDEATADSQTVGTVARVSLAAGLERFEGVPMWLSAVDDDGGLLMWSRDTGSGIESSEPAAPPRNLYVLSAGGRVALVDGLEPTPVSSLAIDGATPRWISARAL